jgi:hypothetical protein
MNDGKTMLAYHNDPALKKAVLAQMAAHAAADELIKGEFWEGGHGCAVGCLTHNSSGGHEEYPARWGIPTALAYLEDGLFEELPLTTAKRWPVRFLNAIPVGTDLSLVWTRFALEILTDPERGVAQHAPLGTPQRVAVEEAIALLRQRIALRDPIAPALSPSSGRALGFAGHAAAYAMSVYPYDADNFVAVMRGSDLEWMSAVLLRLLSEAPIPAVCAP